MPINRRQMLARIGMTAGAVATGVGARSQAEPGDSSSADVRRRVRALPPIIDVHAHPRMPTLANAIRQNASDGSKPVLAPTPSDWTAEQGIELMDAHGIEAMMMSQPYPLGAVAAADPIMLVQGVNDDMADVIARHPRRYGAFAMLPLSDIDASLKEMARALDDLQFDGVCLLTNVDGIYLGDDRFAPLFAELNRRRAVAFVHPTTPAYMSQLALPFDPSIMEFMIDSARAAASLIFSGQRRRFPDFTYISTHGGGTIPYLIRRFETGRQISSAYGVPMQAEQIRRDFQSLHYEMTASTDAGHMASMVELVAPDRLMLGFDYPVRPVQYIEPSRDELASSTYVKDEDLDAICRSTALGLFSRLAGRVERRSRDVPVRRRERHVPLNGEERPTRSS